MTSEERLTPVEVEVRRRKRRRRWFVALLLLLIAACVYWRFGTKTPEEFADIEEHFKYGSIGSELPADSDGPDKPLQGGHLPYRIWRVLPTMFPEYLPADRAGEGYEKFGFLFEEGRDRPVGFSKRRFQGIELLGLNCAVCHTGAVREAEGARRRIIPGMPSNTVDLLAYFRFLFKCAADQRFSPVTMVPAMQADRRLGAVEKAQFQYLVIYRAREGILRSRQLLRYLEPDFGLKTADGKPLTYPRFGPGRVDTFNSVKALRLKFDMRREHWIGTNDFPSIWLQRIRVGTFAHWDGNTDSVEERNLSAALGVGAEPDTIDLPRINRVHQWLLNLQPPKYPFGIDAVSAERGKPLFRQYCARCHGERVTDSWDSWKPRNVGQVVPLERIGTDPHRLHSFSKELAEQTKEIGKGKPWQFRHFRKTHGYVNMPLDGIWARAPYLHNGSVPTLWHLLNPPVSRPKEFHRGGDVYDRRDVGFQWKGPAAMKHGIRFDTSLPGNGNGGHYGPEYGGNLPEAKKRDLLEYLKTL